MALILNGDGSIQSLVAGGLPSGTVTQATLATPVAGTGPAFSAYQSTLQSVSNNTLTKIQLQTEEFDTASAFDSTTNYRFTPQVAGYYQINGAVFFSTATASVIASIYKNGSEYKRGVYFGTSGQSAIVSSLLYLNGSTDYIELYGYQSSGGSLNTQTGITATWFNGSMTRSA
jgi:hypothetical protein